MSDLASPIISAIIANASVCACVCVFFLTAGPTAVAYILFNRQP